eukprot:7363363-Pyramimonas_sp.AAC.1
MARWEMYQAQHGVPVHAPPTYYARVRVVPVLPLVLAPAADAGGQIHLSCHAETCAVQTKAEGEKPRSARFRTTSERE